MAAKSHPHTAKSAKTKAHDPITPGEILLTEFLEPLGISQYRLAQATGLPQTRISEIVRGKRAITTDTALRLSKALGVDDRFWINIQVDYNLPERFGLEYVGADSAPHRPVMLHRAILGSLERFLSLFDRCCRPDSSCC